MSPSKKIPQLNQGHLITRINEYLKWNNVPMSHLLNENGVCKGLSLVYGKYCLEGREEEFINLLRLSSSFEPKEEQAPAVMQFILEVLKAFSPNLFTTQYGQFRSDETVTVNGKPLLSKESIALVASPTVWTDLLNQIDLKQNEVIFLSSPNHAITIKRTDNGYRVYDPNYKNGPKTFNSAQDVMSELKEQVFHFKAEMAMRLKVMSTDPEPRPTIQPRSYYEAMQDLNLEASSFEQANDTIMLAAKNNDANAIRELIAIAKERNIALKSLYAAAALATKTNNVESLSALIPELNKDSRSELYQLALSSGKKETVEMLTASFSRSNIPYSIQILLGAMGQNEELLAQIFSKAAISAKDLDAVKNLLPSLTTIKDGIKNLAKMAIQESFLEAVELVIPTLQPRDKIELAKEALKEGNHSSIVLFLKNSDVEQQELLLAHAFSNTYQEALLAFTQSDHFPQIFSKLLASQREFMCTCALKETDVDEGPILTLLPLLDQKEKTSLAQQSIQHPFQPEVAKALFNDLSQEQRMQITIQAIKDSKNDKLIEINTFEFLINLATPEERLILTELASNEKNEILLDILNPKKEAINLAIEESIELNLADSEFEVLKKIPEEPTSPPKLSFSDLILKRDKDGNNALSLAIKCSHYNASNVHLMLTLLQKEGRQFSSSEKLEYLTKAIPANNPALIELLVGKNNEHISKELLACIKFNSKTMEKLNLHTLETLKNIGLPFNNEMNHHLQKCQMERDGVDLPIGFKLRSFVYFILNVFSKQNIEVDQDKVVTYDAAKQSEIEKRSVNQTTRVYKNKLSDLQSEKIQATPSEEVPSLCTDLTR